MGYRSHNYNYLHSESIESELDSSHLSPYFAHQEVKKIKHQKKLAKERSERSITVTDICRKYSDERKEATSGYPKSSFTESSRRYRDPDSYHSNHSNHSHHSHQHKH